MSFISIASELEFHVVNNFLLCFFITTITTNTLVIGSIIYDLSWYCLPNGEQNFVRIIMRRSQKIIQIKGLGVFVCSLETFLKVKPFLANKIYIIFTQNLLTVDSKCNILLHGFSSIERELMKLPEKSIYATGSYE